MKALIITLMVCCVLMARGTRPVKDLRAVDELKTGAMSVKSTHRPWPLRRNVPLGG
jgi:hypothetical protein